jgi:chemotaxis protein MotA
MLVIVGLIIVFGCVIGGFTMEGGKVGSLVQPAELIVIGGAALGAMVVMSSKKVLIDLVKGVIQCVKGSPYNKAAYQELFKLMYDLFRLARREGLIALEQHVTVPKESEIFKKYPKVSSNHHVVEFICGALAPVIEGTAKPEQLSALLATEMKVLEEEHHECVAVLAKTGDALPGFGIVAAVLGIVITMGAIDGPVEEIGEKVGAALVGTFLGILLSYGFIGPMVGRMESLGAAETAYFRTIANILAGFVSDLPPKVAIDHARRGLSTEIRMQREDLDKMFAEVDAS